MAVHVFVGAGPVNLHLALKIKKADPLAQIIIIDDRIRPETRDFDRERSRANIFRFENEVVTESLIKDGVDPEALEKVSYDRDFSVQQGFQFGDDTVFQAARFKQIQIRDLQQLLLDTLYASPPFPLLWKEKIDLSSYERIEASMTEKLIEKGICREREFQEIHIHIATGVEADTAKQKAKQTLVYPANMQYDMRVHSPTHEQSDRAASPDVAAMDVLPLHGTATFFLKNPEQNVDLSCKQLEEDQRSLDLTPWQEILPSHGWKLLRPPRVRIFYANDVLYIGTEIPEQMNNFDKAEYERQLTDYTRAIAKLAFPNLPIDKLRANTQLRTRFGTPRGEGGVVLGAKHRTSGEQSHTVTRIFNHGDARYLPHYQTGSGFVTGFLTNNVYANVYQHKTFHALYEWAKKENHIDKTLSEKALLAKYTKQISANKSEPTTPVEGDLLSVFQDELYMALSRDIIEHNKEKVGRYFHAIQSQTMRLLIEDFSEILDWYNRYHGTILDQIQFADINPIVVIMSMLRSDNIRFLKYLLPKMVNTDIVHLSDSEIFKLRDIELLNFENNMPEISPGKKKKLEKKWHDILYDDHIKQIEIKTLIEQPEDAIKKLIGTMAKSFTDNKDIHKREYISIFAGKHNTRINRFISDLTALKTNRFEDKRELAEAFIHLVDDFRADLIQGSSQRTLKYLNDYVTKAFDSLLRIPGQNAPHP